MSVTGHRSTHGARSYKEISHEQQHQLNKMIQPESKKLAVDMDSIPVPVGTNNATFNFNSCSVTLKYN